MLKWGPTEARGPLAARRTTECLAVKPSDMLDRRELVDKFGDWSEPFAAACQTALRRYEVTRTRIGLRRGSREHEAVLVARLTPGSRVTRCLLDTSEIAELRALDREFARGCVEIVSSSADSTTEYVFLDPVRTTVDSIDSRHFTRVWRPDPELLTIVGEAVETLCSQVLRQLEQRLDEQSVARIERLVRLYLASSPEIKEFRVCAEDEGAVVVFTGVASVSASWCTQLLRTDNLGVERVRLYDTGDLRLDLSPPLAMDSRREEPKVPESCETAGPARRRVGLRARLRARLRLPWDRGPGHDGASP